jgi:hypothetical protein
MIHRLWRLWQPVWRANPAPWKWNINIALSDLAMWERGEYTWKRVLLNLPTWFGVYEEDVP